MRLDASAKHKFDYDKCLMLASTWPISSEFRQFKWAKNEL